MYVLAPETLHEAWLLISRANHEKRKSQQAAKLYHHIYHFIILGCVIVHGDYRRWQMSVNRDPSVECCVCNDPSVECCVCNGQIRHGPSWISGQPWPLQWWMLATTNIGSSYRDVMLRLLVGDNQLHGWHLCKTPQIFMHIFQQKCANFGVVCIPSPGAGGSDASSSLYLDKNWKFDLSRRAHSQVSAV